jgi:peroxiredoxin
MTSRRSRFAAAVLTTATLGLASVAAPAGAAPTIGQPAPDFTGTDSSGNTHTLSDFRGKVVVLEWTNHECPYTVKHYEAGAMQALQKQATGDGAVWLSVISSAPGTQGYVTADQATSLTRSRDAAPTAVLLDPEGDIGKRYDAKTTPHMYVIDGDGTLVYMGAIDDDSSSRGDPAKADNHVRAALADLAAGQPVKTAVTRPYGCTVKYSN